MTLRDIKNITVTQGDTKVFFDMNTNQATPNNFDKKFGVVGMKAILKSDENRDMNKDEYQTTIDYYNKEYDVLINFYY